MLFRSGQTHWRREAVFRLPARRQKCAEDAAVASGDAQPWRKGIKVFPDNEPLPGTGDRKRWPIIKNGQAVPRSSLGEAEKALGSPLPELQEFGRVYRFDLAELVELFQETSFMRGAIPILRHLSWSFQASTKDILCWAA